MALNLGFKTENGWPACDAASTDRANFPGTGVYVPTQIGIPSTILKAFGADFAAIVEPLDQSQCGGWTPTNSVATSNHLGGTAMDLNWRIHPMGNANAGYSTDQVAKIRQLLDFYEGTVFWGNDWDSPKDSMHFQMGYNTFGQAWVQDFINRKINADGTSTFSTAPKPPPRQLKPVVPGPNGTFWNDVSQYQQRPVNDSYRWRVFAFRTNTGDKKDTLAIDNAQNALRMLNEGKLDIVIPYYFFRPGQANCDLHRSLLESAGLWNHPQTASMVDVEGDNGSVSGDNTWEINDEITRMQGWYSNNLRVIGYLNPNADPGLWLSRPYGVPLVIPQYGRTAGDISSIKNKAVAAEAFAHQFTSSATNQSPWNGQNVDVNWTPYSVPELAVLLGIAPPIQQPDPGTPVDPGTPTDPTPVDPTGPFDWSTRFASLSRYRDNNDAVWSLADMLRFIDARSHELEVERAALYGDPDSINLIVRQAKKGDKLAYGVLKHISADYLKGIDLSGLS